MGEDPVIERGVSKPWLVWLLWCWTGLALVTFVVMLTHRSDAPVLMGRYSLPVSLMLGGLLAATVSGAAAALVLRQLARQRRVEAVLAELRARRWSAWVVMILAALLLVGVWLFFLGNHLLTYAALRFFLVATIIIGASGLLYGGASPAGDVSRASLL